MAERQLAKTENIINRTTKQMQGETEEKREWFQTPKQRFAEKQRLAVSEDAMPDKNKRGGQKRTKGGRQGGGPDSKKSRAEKTPEELAEERSKRELQKVAQVQAKFSKAKFKPHKLRAIADPDVPSKQTPGKKQGKKDRVVKSNFANDLTDVSNKGAKKFRHQATKAKNEFARNKAKGRPPVGPRGKTSAVKLTNKAGMNKFNKGKNFGAPKKGKKGK